MSSSNDELNDTDVTPLDKYGVGVASFQQFQPDRARLSAMSIEDIAVAARLIPNELGADYRKALWDRIEPKERNAIRYRFANLALQARMESDDLLSESYLVLENAIKHYDSDKGRSFWPYYETGLVYHFIGLANRSKKIKNVELKEELSVVAESRQFGNVFTERELTDQLLPNDVKHRSEKLLVFQLHHFHDITQTELSKQFNKSAGTINNWIGEVAMRLREVC